MKLLLQRLLNSSIGININFCLLLMIESPNIIQAGYTKLYCPTATVYHSHDYTPAETYKRSRIEGDFFRREFGYRLVDGPPEQIVARAAEEDAQVVGLSILSGSHLPLIAEVMERMRSAGLAHVPVVVGGIIPDDDALALKKLGVARVYTPKDFELNRIMQDIVLLAEPSAVAAQ